MTALMNRPRGLMRVFAQDNPADVRAAILAVDEGIRTFKAVQTQRVDTLQANVQAAIDDMSGKLAAIGLNGNPSNLSAAVAPDPAYSTAYASWLRQGSDDRDNVDTLRAANREGVRKEIMASMSAGSVADGGYLAPSEWDRDINRAMTAKSPLRRLATVVETKVRAYSTLWSDDGWGTGWVGETAQRPATATPTLKPLEFDHGEIYANPAITQRLLDDADYPIQQWMETEITDEFARQESIAFVAGSGVNKPRGFLTYVPGGASETTHPGGTLKIVPSGSAGEIGGPDVLLDFVFSLPVAYRQNAKWLMASTTAAAIAKMKDGQGNYIWRETYVAGQPSTLLGYAVEIDDNMPGISAGNLPIAFGDFKAGYLINDRYGIRVLRDPYSNKPYVHFYTTKRVGGGVRDPKAIQLLKIAVS